jgi:VIT1/CCC1 family predicted Fe2+/Mn2+ transporter
MAKLANKIATQTIIVAKVGWKAIVKWFLTFGVGSFLLLIVGLPFVFGSSDRIGVTAVVVAILALIVTFPRMQREAPNRPQNKSSYAERWDL